MRKQILQFTIMLCCILAMPLATFGTEFTVDNLTYTINTDDETTVSVSGYENKPTGALTIPAKVEEYTVTAIADGASLSKGVFYNCTGLTSVTIPETLNSIGNYAFYKCTGLKSVVIPEGSVLTTIGLSAFYYCSALTSIDIPASVTTIGDNAFDGCSLLATVTFGDGSKLETIGSYAFYNCSSLISIDIPASVTKIDSRAFYKCSALTEIEIPKGVTSIGSHAFSGCSSLASVTFAHDSQLTTISQSTFYYCSSLTSVYIPTSVITIENGAFNGCTALASIDIPASVTTILTSAFSNCYNLDIVKVSWDGSEGNEIAGYSTGIFSKQVILSVPSGTVEKYKEEEGWKDFVIITDGDISAIIGVTDNGLKYYTYQDEEQTFADIYGYEAEIIDENLQISETINNAQVKKIFPYTFYNSDALTSIDIPATVTEIGTYTFCNCSKLTSVTFAEGSELITIGTYAFNKCSALTSVEIPASVTEIGTYAFNGCSNLLSVIANSSSPATAKYVSFPYSTSAMLYVPEGCTDIYKKASNWGSQFNNYNNIANWYDELTINNDEEIKDLSTESDIYRNIIIEYEAEVNAENANLIILETLTIERTFTYADGKASNEQWFNLGLPFVGIASGTYVQKYNSETGEYESAICGVDYATASYNSERRAADGYDSSGSNWDLQITEGDELGELIQFATNDHQQYRFISPSATEATSALKTGRTGSTYYNSDMASGGANGWNVVPAGKTYSAIEEYDIISKTGITAIYQYDGVSQFTTIDIEDMETLAPGDVFVVQLLKDYAESTGASSGNSEATVERYRFELVDAEGATLDRIYLYDGSNHVKYRLGKFSSMSSDIAQMAITVDGSSYSTYSTLASETDKSYNVSLTNTNGASLVMKTAGSQAVTVDGAVVTLDTPISVEDGEIVITIGSTVTGVDSLTDQSVVISSANGAISISGVESGTAYAITSMSGITTYGTASGETTSIDEPAGVYIVRINNTVTKVIVK